MGRRRVLFRELERVLGCAHASSKVDTPVRCADCLDESCSTYWLFETYAQRSGDPKFQVNIVLLNLDAIGCCLSHTPVVSTYWRQGGCHSSGCSISEMFCCPARPEFTTRGPMLSGGTISMWRWLLFFWFERFTSIITFVGFFPSRRYCLATV